MAGPAERALPVEAAAVVRAVTAIMGTVVGLTFLFGFGNVLNLALRLGVPVWVAPLVAPAVDLSILGLLLGIRHLALAGVAAAQSQPARRLLVFASLVTLALNVADPIVAGDYGKAAFDAVGPLLLIGWAEVGPGLLQAMSTTHQVYSESDVKRSGPGCSSEALVQEDGTQVLPPAASPDAGADGLQALHDGHRMIDDALLERARREDVRHWAECRRPISADSLRKRLGIGASRARLLVSEIRGVSIPAPPTKRTVEVSSPVGRVALSTNLTRVNLTAGTTSPPSKDHCIAG